MTRLIYFRIHQSCHDRAAQFVMLIAKPGSNYLDNEDFVLLIQVSYMKRLNFSDTLTYLKSPKSLVTQNTAVVVLKLAQIGLTIKQNASERFR